MKILGIDEAGRGCVIGPMVLAAAMVTRHSWDELLKEGVQDSKQLSAKKRISLCEKIRDIVLGEEISIVSPQKIDIYCQKNRLNVLEAEIAVELIQLCEPNIVYIDAPGKGGKKFAEQLQKLLDNPKICIVAENHADANYVAVAAASILAKVTRDEEVAKLREEFGDFGSGYPSDPKTQKFLNEVCSSKTEIPHYIRRSWSTVKRLVGGKQLSFDLDDTKENQ